MPVISLPEYLGLQEAPQQPVFNRTRQLEPDNPWARTMEVADSLTALRQQRPLSQIQAIQNQYDTIRDNAEKLRREREVAMQAEQAVSALSRMTPDDPDYENQRMQFQQQLPMAQFDPRVNSILSDNDQIYAARQQAEAKRQQEIIDRAAELAGVGMNPQEAMQYAQQGPIAVSEAKYRATRKPEASNRIEQIAGALKTVQDMMKGYEEEDRYDFVDGQRVVRPDFQKLLDRQQKYADMYFNEIEGVEPTPSAAQVQAGGAQIPFRPGVQPAQQQVVTPTPVEQTINLDNVPLSEIENTIKQTKEAAEADASKREAWNKAQMSLEKSLTKAFPGNYEGTNYSKLRRIAKAIVDGERIPDPNPKVAYDESGAAQTISVVEDVLSKIGTPIKAEAFKEPGTGRQYLWGLIGDQRVPYDELLKVWAQNYLNRSNVTVSPNQGAISAEMNKAIEDVLK